MNAAERAQAYEQLCRAARQDGLSFSDLLHQGLERARYRLGSFPTDWRVPYTLDPELTRPLSAALLELAALVVGRNRAFLGEEFYDALLLQVEASRAVLGPAVYRAPIGVKNTVVAGILNRSAEVLLGLDAGVLLAWWGPQGRGRILRKVLTDLQQGAFLEMEEAGATELTPAVVQWALLAATDEIDAVLAPLGWPAPVRQEVETALRLGLHWTHHLVLAQVRERPPASSALGERATEILAALLCPRLAFRDRPALRGLCHFYPLEAEALGARAEGLQELLDRGQFVEARDLAIGWLGSDARLAEQAALGLAEGHLRERLLGLQDGAPPADGLAHFALQTLRAITPSQAELRDRRWRRETAQQLARLAKREPDRPRGERAQSLGAWLKRINPAEGKALGQAGPDRDRAILSVLASTGDRLVEQIAAQALPRLSRRTGAERDRDLDSQYESGRLYRFGAPARPCLRTTQAAGLVGHYFIDVKDFTRQTALLKEESMAEFLQHQFYQPILEIAREHYRGLPQLADRGGVHLNNLLGDAISFSGDPVSLVQIARKIRTHLDSYARGLGRRLGLADGGRFGAGSFISFGAAPVVVTFRDEVWGDVRVSIAEKINESARGTARPAEVLEELSTRFARVAAVEPAFRVHVEPVTRLQLPSEIAAAIFRHREAGDRARVMRSFQLAARWFLQQAERHAEGGPAGPPPRPPPAALLYNTGDALSEEALKAYRRAMGRGRWFFQIDLAVDTLAAELRNRYAFDEATLALVAGVDPVGGRVSELFRFAGTVLFKGFEQDLPVGIWEMVNLGEPVGQALASSERWAIARELAPPEGSLQTFSKST